MVLLGLAVVWAIVLLPEALKRISKARSGDSIRSFNHQLSSLERGNPHASPAQVRSTTRDRGRASNVIELRSGTPRASAPDRSRHTVVPASAPAAVHPAVRRRRQEVLTALGAASVLSLLCSVAFGGPFLVLFVLSAVLLVGYVAALYQVMNSAPQTSRNVNSGVDPLRPRHMDDLHGVRISAVSPRRIAN